MKFYFFLLSLLLAESNGFAQAGCTDSRAGNYNSAATINDGSCSYAAASLALTNATDLPSAIHETSSLIYTEGGLWTLNDSGNDPSFYQIDKNNGHILKTVNITDAANLDWEAITADEHYFYIGDFGNNQNGNRTDLTIYRVLKADIGSGSIVNVAAEEIHFSYPEQVISGPTGNNNTKYDCETMLIKDNVLHLFTKDWITGHTQHYSLPSAPGTYSATLLEDYNIQGLVTDASLSATNEMVLIGYTTDLINLFMYVLYDYSGDHFFSGNKRKLDMGHSLDLSNLSNSKGQTEGVAFSGNGTGYVSSEEIGPVPPRLYSFTIADLITLPVHLEGFKASYTAPYVKLEWQTSAEINNDYFSIQRSKDAVQYTEIGRQRSLITSREAKNYSYLDEEPLPGMNYYRLMQMDRDGKGTTSSARAVNVSSSGYSLRAYVNASKLIIDAGNTFNRSHYFQLINVNGSILLQGTLASARQTVNISGLPKGGYFLRMGSETTRFIK